MLFWTSALASTIPTPSGIFIPVLKMGAAYGRLIGEIMHATFPEGVKYTEFGHPVTIIPGSYAVVGAAAFSGAVTHTISTSVILFEMTGQIVHIIPVILGVLIANAVCQSLQPSIYDSIIEIKKLPYLPPIASSNSVSHKILVKDFMNTNIAYVWKHKCSYGDVKKLLSIHKKLVSFPLVESPVSMKLLGSVARPDLLKLLYLHLGRERRLQEVFRRNSDTFAPTLNYLTTVSDKLTSLSCDRGDPKSSGEPKVAKSKIFVEEPPKVELKGEDDLDEKYSSVKSTIQKPPKHELASVEVEAELLKIVPSDVQQRFDADIEACQRETDTKMKGDSIAKVINLYNRGSALDESKIDASERAIKNRMTFDNQDKIVSEANTLSRAPTRGTLMVEADTKQQLTGVSPSISTRSANLSRQRQTSYASPKLNPAKPTKSILKTSSSGSFASVYKRNVSSQSFSSTMTALESSKQRTMQTMGSPSNNAIAQDPFSTRSLDENNTDGKAATLVRPDFVLGDGSNPLELTPVRKRRKVRLPRLRVVDMTLEEQESWEKEQLNAYIDISSCQVDEAPFQLVEQTSLYRVHTLFSMLGLNHAYVTSFGRLVGIVALKDIRQAIEKMLQDRSDR